MTNDERYALQAACNESNRAFDAYLDRERDIFAADLQAVMILAHATPAVRAGLAASTVVVRTSRYAAFFVVVA